MLKAILNTLQQSLFLVILAILVCYFLIFLAQTGEQEYLGNCQKWGLSCEKSLFSEKIAELQTTLHQWVEKLKKQKLERRPE